MFKTNVWFSSFAALTVILAAWYMIRFFQNSMNGPVTASPHEVAMTAEDPERTVYEYPVLRRLISGDLRLAEIGLLVPLVLLILYIGIQPDPLTARINPAANGTTTVVRTAHTSLPSAASPSGAGTNGGAAGGGR
jgi:NADH-quinone oxidoreductase subunit M